MEICFLIRSLDMGGAQTQLGLLLDGLSRRKHQVHLVTYYDSDSRDFDGDVIRHSLGKRGRYDLPAPGYRLVNLLRGIRPKILHTYLPSANVVGAMVKSFVPGVRLVWGMRAADMHLQLYDRISRMPYRWQRRLMARADLALCNSNAAFTRAVQDGLPPRLLRVVRNGFDTDRFRPEKVGGVDMRAEWGVCGDAIVVGHVARLDPIKDHATFLNSVANVASRHPDARFVCVGDGPAGELNRLISLARTLGVGDRVIWAGAVDNMRAVYNAFDVNVSSSLSESLPNVVGEAMACGVPCVVTQVGDSTELIGDTGIAVPAANADALAAAVSKLITMAPGDRSAQGRRARRRIEEQFSAEKMVVATEKLLIELGGG